jgi:ArsR family transcriptional regulator, lead/cadmium/zinc/bismuth-responsive transcriptional repressor
MMKTTAPRPAPAVKKPPRPENRERLQALADLFKHLSDPRRLQLLLWLEQGEHSVCDLALRLGVTVSAVSHQLQTLRRARLVAFRRAGKICFYRLIDAHVHQLVKLGREHVRE